MRPRIPLAYAGLLIIALVSIVGFAAFSPASSDGTSDQSQPSVEAAVVPVSARVASAILALRVSDADARLTESPSTSGTSSPAAESSDPATPSTVGDELVEGPTTSAVEPVTTVPEATTTPPKPKDTTPPPLKITSPSDGATVNDRVVTFEGTSESGASVTSGPYEAHVDDDGDWFIKLVVSSEGSKATITAKDKAGNTTTESITVTYEPPTVATTTTTTKASSPPPAPPPEPKWSPQWPADPGGRQSLEHWRPLVEKYWPANLANCALNILYFESFGNARAYNSSGPGFEGLFQHHSGYWKGRAAAAGFRDSDGLYASPYSAEANIAVAWYLAKNSTPWNRHWSVDPHHPNAPLECTE
ncbi:MAG: hypothetical protein M5U23_09630 [Acidimicrobiia bacterium]|nr:hypothetical protein [Acidimicrobiia bacterium]